MSESRLKEIERNLIAQQAREVYEQEQQAEADQRQHVQQVRAHREEVWMKQATTILQDAMPLFAERDAWLMNGKGDIHELKRIADAINMAEHEAKQVLELLSRQRGNFNVLPAWHEAMQKVNWPAKDHVPEGADKLTVVLWRAFVFGYIHEAGVMVASSSVNLTYAQLS